MRGGKHRRWTDEEIDILLANAHMSDDELSDKLHRTDQAINAIRRKLRGGWQPAGYNTEWTDEEEQIILNTAHMTSGQVAKLLPGRTTSAVTNRREYLTRSHGIHFGSSNKSPFKIGKRPLVAASCRGCGLILSREWFYFTPGAYGGRWDFRCRKCHSDMTAVRRHVRPADRPPGEDKWRKVMQQATRAQAENKGQPFTTSDHGVLADPDLSIFEKALTLKRSYNSIACACSLNGYTSRRMNKLEPEEAQWLIRLRAEIEEQLRHAGAAA